MSLMFLRLVTNRKDSHSCQCQGVFQFAYALDRSGVLTTDETLRLGSILDWFETYLPIPRNPRITPGTIFWFKARADTMVRTIWQLAEFAWEHGLDAELIRTTRPGYIRYEDDFQIAAIPFRDTFRMTMRHPHP